jgi:hypothetical protein
MPATKNGGFLLDDRETETPPKYGTDEPKPKPKPEPKEEPK